MSSIAQEQIATIAEVVIAKFNELQQEEQTKKADRRLFNTRLLLRNYHKFKVRCEELKELNKVEMEGDPFIEIVGEYLSIESLTRSSVRTMNMMNFIDKMLEFYKNDCIQQGKEAIRKYDTLMHYYIYEDKMTYVDIAELHNINERTARRDLKEAVQELSVLIFGIDGLRIQL